MSDDRRRVVALALAVLCFAISDPAAGETDTPEDPEDPPEAIEPKDIATDAVKKPITAVRIHRSTVFCEAPQNRRVRSRLCDPLRRRI